MIYLQALLILVVYTDRVRWGTCLINRDTVCQIFYMTDLNSKRVVFARTTGSKFYKNLRIVECHDYIWINHEKYIQISTIMPSIG